MRRRAWFNQRFVWVESRRAYRMACILFWSILMYLFFAHYVVGLGIVTDRSMLPTVSDGDYYLVNKYIYHVTRPRRGDVVALHPDPLTEETYVKRVIGLSGETLRLHEGGVYIDGRLLEESYASGLTFPDLGPQRIEARSYFVMGDNRLKSFDSRAFGTVPLERIKGKIRPGKLFAFW